MDTAQQKALLAAIDKALDPKIQLTDNLTLRFDLPTTFDDYRSLDSVKDFVGSHLELNLKLSDTFSIDFEQSGKDSYALKLTKKF